MGKPKTLSKKAKKLAKKKGLPLPGVQPDINKFSIEEVLDKADSFIEEYNYDMAQKFLERALEINADHPRALETTASLLLEAGQIEKAKQCLGRAITVQPNQGHTKYFSLAQLFNGDESLQIYRQGIRLVEEILGQLEASEAIEARKECASAYCAVAELYMTDLCDDPEAETECTNSVSKAVEVDPENPEAWQTKARLHLIKSDFDEARNCLNKSLDLWLPKYLAVLENRAEAAGSFDPVELCPLIYTTRLSTARMLIELEEWDKAQSVLDGLVEEDEEIVDAWYLLGWLNKLRTDAEKDDVYLGAARYYLGHAKEVHIKNPTKDKEMVKHIEELINEVGPEPVTDDKVEEDDEDWEDEDDNDNMEES